MDNQIKYCDEHFELLAMRIRFRMKDGDIVAKQIEDLKSLQEKIAFAESNPVLKEHLNDVINRESFELMKLTMEAGFWKMKLNIHEQIPKVHRNYQMIFTVNLDNVDRQILNSKKAIANEENEAILFPEEKQKNIDELRKQLKQQEEDKRALIERYEDLIFSASVEEVKYKNTTTEIVFSIPANVIENFNKHRFEMSGYLVELRKI